MNKILDFFVPGVPKPGGSKRAFIPKGWTRPIITDACAGNKDWRASVAQAAHEAMQGRPLIDSPLHAVFTFYMPRPKSHFRANGELKNLAEFFQHAKKPDVTKLVRAAEDALTGIVWRDDAQIVRQTAEKVYTRESSGMHVEVSVFSFRGCA